LKISSTDYKIIVVMTVIIVALLYLQYM